MKNFKLVSILCVTFLHSQIVCQSVTNYFRYDYKYLMETDSFYKIHTIDNTWLEAKRRCELEGASFFYPEDQHEVNSVISFWNKTQPFNAVYIGISDILAKGVYTTVNGDSIKDVYNYWAPGEPNNSNTDASCLVLTRDGTLNDDQCSKKYPFICKKLRSSLKWNTLCNIPDLDYTYNEDLGRCYKVHKAALNWTEAALVCDIEQSYLAIVNSETEAATLALMSKELVGADGVTSNSCDSVALGFNNKNNQEWKTVLGTKLDDSGYVKWAENHPNGDQSEQCGFMTQEAVLKGLSCQSKCHFICEHEISLLTGLDERTGT